MVKKIFRKLGSILSPGKMVILTGVFAVLVVTGLTYRGGPIFGLMTASGLDTITASRLSRWEEENRNRLFRKLFSLETREEVVMGLDWLKPRVVDETKGPRYAYAYAFNLWRAGIKDTAVAMWLPGRLLAMVDASKCKDDTARAGRPAQLDRLVGPVINHYQTLERQGRDLEQEKGIALMIEDQYVNPGPNPWICKGGMAYIQRLMEENPETMLEPGEKADQAIGGSPAIPEEPSVKPELIPKEHWDEARAEAVARFRESIEMVSNNSGSPR